MHIEILGEQSTAIVRLSVQTKDGDNGNPKENRDHRFKIDLDSACEVLSVDVH